MAHYLTKAWLEENSRYIMSMVHYLTNSRDIMSMVHYSTKEWLEENSRYI